MRAFVLIFLILLTGALSMGQLVRQAASEGSEPASGVTGPQMGIIAGKSTGVRLIRGIPGAASMGPALAAPELAAWAVSSDRDYMIGVAAETGRVVLARELSRGARVSALGRWGLRDASVAVSSNGEAAAVFSAGLGRMLVFTGLPDEPALAWSHEFSGGLSTLAVRDDGERVAVATQGELLEIARGGEERIALLAGRASVAYLPESEEIVYSDLGARSVSWLRAGAVSRVAGEQDGVTSPVAVAAPDGRRIFIANEDPPSVAMVDLERGTVERIDTPRRPTTLRRLSGGLFQLNEADDGTVYVLFAEEGRPRIAFIPPPADDGVRGGAK